MSGQKSNANEGPAGLAVDGLEFARGGRRLEFSAPVAGFGRLADLVVGDSGSLECRVRGEQDQDGKAFLVVRVSGALALMCQRCLGVVRIPLVLESRLLLVPPGQPWPDEELMEDGYDAVAAGKEMALLPMVEDEVLLALPIAPCHESCEPPVATDEEIEPSPFAVLAKLKKGV